MKSRAGDVGALPGLGGLVARRLSVDDPGLPAVPAVVVFWARCGVIRRGRSARTKARVAYLSFAKSASESRGRSVRLGCSVKDPVTDIGPFPGGDKEL